MNKKTFKVLILVILIVISTNSVFSQSVAVTDNDLYTPDPTAMLDVMSTDKGMLVPRMTTVERLVIGLPGVPATGLMVYDTDFNNFFYYNGLTWMSFPQIGSSGFGGPLFHVINSYGDTIFAVYDDGVQIIVPQGVKGKVGGFAISGRSPSKTTPDNYMVITPDSARIYINDTVTAKGKVGGFAISGRSPSKGTSNDVFFATVDSTRIYVDESNAKGKVGGFAISGRSPSKATTQKFMDMTKENYFIGHESGISNTTGKYNSFFGYQAGKSNMEGNENIFIGYQSGLSNVGGNLNTFLGYQAGHNNTGSDNTFIGNKAGSLHQSKGGNVFIGSNAGDSALNGERNIFIGESAGHSITDGSWNNFIGYQSGFENSTGGYNNFIGYQSGLSNSSGIHNIFIGYQCGMNNTTGFTNVFIGDWAGKENVNGQNNVYIGPSSGLNTGTKFRNTFIGGYTGSNSGGSDNVFIGYKAGQSEAGSNKLYISNNTANLIYGDFSAHRVGIYTISPSVALDVNGNGRFRSISSGAYLGVVNRTADGTLTTSTSDIRLKENIKPLQNSLEKVKNLQGVSFNWKNDELKSPKIGLIAQDVEKILPELVFTNPTDGYKGINYAEINAVLIEAIKEQQKQIDDLKKLIQQKDFELHKADVNDEQINLLIEENKKLKNDISHIMDLLQSNVIKE
jgi:hypothetical protein